MPHPLRAPRRFERRGVTLVETLIVLTFFGFVGSIVTLAVSSNARARAKAALGFAEPPPPPASPPPDPALVGRATSEHSATLVQGAALHWLEGRAESACPAIEELVDEGVASLHWGRDAWGNPFEIACEGDDVFVHSPGADRVRGTGDDIVVPRPARGPG
jgi:hypothetical protein